MEAAGTEDITTLLPGTVINGYRIERKIGHGNMAVVYLATQLDLGRPVAFKVLSGSLAENKEFVKRFFNEARAAAQLTHPNIIQALNAGQTESGLYYFCMEYVDGETMLDIIKREGHVPYGKCMVWFQQIANALNYGWQKHRFSHGDIKPENIIITRDGKAKLADFGLAKVEGHDYAGKTIMLTPLYAAPELIRGETTTETDCRADIYAFGASLYHALAGSPPFPGTDAQTVMKRHLEEPLEPLCQRNTAIAKPVSKFVGKMLVKGKESRLQNWVLVLAEMEKLLQNNGGERGYRTLKKSSARSTVVASDRSKILVHAVILLLLLGILGGMLVILSNDEAAKRVIRKLLKTEQVTPSAHGRQKASVLVTAVQKHHRGAGGHWD